jgi:DNA gyrase/topoisomerase IV subunit A
MKINMKERAPQLVAIIGVLAIVMAILIGFLVNKNTQVSDMQQLLEISHQDLLDEFEAIALQYEGFRFSVQNDSLLYRLENEQARVRRLEEELRRTDASNQAEIRRLRDELATLRQILRSSIQQIDSLNQLNQALRAENVQITQQFQQTARTLTQVTQERQQLSQQVSLAAQLVATGINVRAVNDRGRDQTRLSRSAQFVVSFTIARNITAVPGERNVYVRIMSPGGTLLSSRSGGTFAFENSNIHYSMRRTVEYGGEDTPVTLFWDIGEFLMPGTFTVDIFADGNHIGTHNFTMQE